MKPKMPDSTLTRGDLQEKRALAAERNAALLERRAVLAETLATTLSYDIAQARAERDVATERAAQAESEAQGLHEWAHREITALRSILDGMQASLSWRLTRPLRNAKSFLKDGVSAKRSAEPAGADGGDATPHDVDEMHASLLPAAAPKTEAEAPPYQSLAGGLAEMEASHTVLIVTESALPGTPTLPFAQALLDAIREAKYRSVVLLLDDDAEPAYLAAGAAEVIIAPQARESYIDARKVINHLLHSRSVDLALVNGMGCRTVLSPLAGAHVPIVSFLHDMASYSKTLYEYQEIIYWSTRTVFTSRIVYQLAHAALPRLDARATTFLPLGGIAPDVATFRDETDLSELKTELLDRLPIVSADAEARVVLGSGFYTYEGGADLFIACAARMRSMPGGDRLQFVWLGQGTSQAEDARYRAALMDQVARYGLQGQLVMMSEPIDTAVALEVADIVLFTVRSDTMPIAALEAVRRGVPILCFEQTSALAEALSERPDAAEAVLPYLDVVEMAGRAMTWLAQPDRLAAQADLALKALQEHLRGEQSLVSVALAAVDLARQEAEDLATIQASGQLLVDYFGRLHDADNAAVSDVHKYLRSWKTGLGVRKPRPGFHPGVYRAMQLQDQVEVDPFADFLRQGEPAGPWAYPVIHSTDASAGQDTGSQPLRTALHLHVYYPELLPEMLERLALNESQPDLFISVKDEPCKARVQELVGAYAGAVAEVVIVPNAGRDIGPMLTAFGPRLCRDYAVIGHLHTKQSLHLADRDVVAAWRTFLLENLLGGTVSGPMMDKILSAMGAQRDIGLVFPDDPNIIAWDANRDSAEALRGPLGIPELPEAFNFPVGTMFWVRADVLARFVDLGLNWDDYPAEPLPPDGTMLHAIERLFGVVPAALGLKCAVTYVDGLSR